MLIWFNTKVKWFYCGWLMISFLQVWVLKLHQKPFLGITQLLFGWSFKASSKWFCKNFKQCLKYQKSPGLSNFQNCQKLSKIVKFSAIAQLEKFVKNCQQLAKIVKLSKLSKRVSQDSKLMDNRGATRLNYWTKYNILRPYSFRGAVPQIKTQLTFFTRKSDVLSSSRDLGFANTFKYKVR